MFGFFVNDEFKGFWCNRPGDMFVDLTCQKLNWPKQQTTVVYYPDLKDSELQHAQPSTSKVDIYQEIMVENGVDENQQPIMETSLVLVKSINADSFMVNGIMIIPC